MDFDYAFTNSFTAETNKKDNSENKGNNINFMLHSLVL